MAGCLNVHGYVSIQVNSKVYLAHRLAWIYVHGSFPKDQIDHINSDKTDNRICNLREANQHQNNENQRKPRSDNTSGYLGVSWDKQVDKYKAQIRIDGKTKYIGHFKQAKVAHEAYIKVKRKVHEFCTI